MAKVIKAGAGAKAPLPQGGARMGMPVGRKVLEREVYQAQNEAKQILDEAADKREKLLADAKRHAAQAREEAMSKGAAEAFAQAASEALLAFRRRAQRYAEASDDIRTLALEIAKKVLGVDPALPTARVDEIMKKGMAQLRARRRLRVQVPASRLESLADERPKLMRALKDEPDLVVEPADDVNPGFARVVTEIGGALCAEATALDSLADAVGVVEEPKPRARFEQKVEQARAAAGGAGKAPNEPPRAAKGPPPPKPPADDDDVSFEDTGDYEESDDATMALVERPRRPAEREPARRPSTSVRAPPLADPIAARPGAREGGAASARERSTATPSARPGTRALQLDADPDGTQALDVNDFRKRELKRREEAPSEVDESMELYTDDAVAPRKRR